MTASLLRQRFGYLTAVALVRRDGRAQHYRCVCDCGNTTVVRGDNLRRGAVRSCGCLRRDGERLPHDHRRGLASIEEHW